MYLHSNINFKRSPGSTVGFFQMLILSNEELTSRSLSENDSNIVLIPTSQVLGGKIGLTVSSISREEQTGIIIFLYIPTITLTTGITEQCVLTSGCPIY